MEFPNDFDNPIPVANRDTPKNESLSINDFSVKYPEQSHLAQDILLARNEGIRLILVAGKVKSGKSLFPRYCSLAHRTPQAGQVRVKNYFITSLNRKADHIQFEEHRDYYLEVCTLYNGQKVDECLNKIERDLKAGKKIMIHIDELDYGSATTGLLAKVWNKVKDNLNVCYILYSATPEEIEQSEPWQNTPAHLKKRFQYTPNANYCGDLIFLQQGLVHRAEAAFTYNSQRHEFNIGKQFSGILKEMKRNMENPSSPYREKYITVLRLNYEITDYPSETKKGKRAFTLFLENIVPRLQRFGYDVKYSKTDVKHINTQAEGKDFNWQNRGSWSSFSKPTVIVIDSTVTRSTELKIHNYIFAWHEFRPAYTYTSSVQSEQRVVHYKGREYPEFTPIHVYGCPDSWRRSANLISEKDLLAKDLELEFERLPGFHGESLTVFLKSRNMQVNNVIYLKELSEVDPKFSYFRVNDLSKTQLENLKTILNMNKDVYHYSSYNIIVRDNIEGLASRVDATERTEEVDVYKEFVPWPLNADGTPQEYGSYNTEGSFGKMIHAIRKMHEAELPEDEVDRRHFNSLTLRQQTVEQLRMEDTNFQRKGHVPKASDGRWCAFFEQMENGEYRPYTWDEISQHGTGLTACRQTICYRGNQLGIGLRIPTGDVSFHPKTKTNKTSMYSGRPAETTRGRGRGRGRGRSTV